MVGLGGGYKSRAVICDSGPGYMDIPQANFIRSIRRKIFSLSGMFLSESVHNDKRR
jgi:hypothetical protein